VCLPGDHEALLGLDVEDLAVHDLEVPVADLGVRRALLQLAVAAVP
jgi:hypothetical protein